VSVRNVREWVVIPVAVLSDRLPGDYDLGVARRSGRTETRIGHEARAAATGTLDTALREGRLDLAEYERRLVVIQGAKVRDHLTPVLADLPSRAGQIGPELRVSTADREAALVRLADALTDGRVEADAYVDAEELLHRAVTYADIDAVVGNLDARASVAERDQAIARIEAAVVGGQLEPAERDARVAAVRRATTDAQLAALVADLSSDTWSPGAPLRASNDDRQATVARLQDAVEAGLLDVTEFDERVRAVYAARLRDELARLLADLPEPAAPPAPRPSAPRVRSSPPRTTKQISTTVNLVGISSTIVATGAAVGFGAAGFPIVAILLAGAWVLGMVALVTWAVSALKTPEPAPRDEAWTREVEPLLREFEPVSPELEPVAPEFEPVSQVAEAPGKRLLKGHKNGVLALTCLVLPDGTPVAVSGGRDNTARVWNLNDDSLRHTLKGHTHDVRGVAAIVLPDGSPVAVTLSGDRTARVWDLNDGSQCGILPDLAEEPQSVSCMSLADGTPVAVARGLHGVIQMWDLRDHKLLSDVSVDLFMEAMVSVVLPDDTPVAVACDMDGSIEVVNLENGKTRSVLRGHTGVIRSVDATVLPDGTVVAVSVSGDKTIRVWDLRYGKLLRTISGMINEREAVVCTSLPDGTPAAIACDYYENTMAWDLRDGSELPYRLDLRGDVIAGVALENRTLVLGPGDDGSAIEVHALT
jgi:hypothetical protein